MIDGNLFDSIEEIAQVMRTDMRPFGGLQLVLCGDFLQLPPVGKRLCIRVWDLAALNPSNIFFIDKNSRDRSACFAFQSKSWEDCIGLHNDIAHSLW